MAIRRVPGILVLFTFEILYRLIFGITGGSLWVVVVGRCGSLWLVPGFSNYDRMQHYNNLVILIDRQLDFQQSVITFILTIA